MCHRDAGDGGPAQVVLGITKASADLAEHADLMTACMRSGRAGGSIPQTTRCCRHLMTQPRSNFQSAPTAQELSDYRLG
jgi:hypothetical protein